MTPCHHLDPSTVMAYAAGTLSLELGVVVATHLSVCAHCRRQVRDAERIGGLLVEQQQAATIDAPRRESLRAAMLERLDDAVPALPPVPQNDAESADPDRLPKPLHPYFGPSLSALKWRWMAPGMYCIRARRSGGGSLFMLKIAAGKSMPLHSHGRSELTQILQGAYSDALGHFAPGDVADLDSDVLHQPVTVPGVPCICVAALDAPLRFPGWLARKLQPLVGL
ncbi:ChrR family anti-sigma-E factor [Dyella sp. A6]|uniref:ChrR family anti-sigma-E factor n=1 Tax=Dyella aluminiiresistens TaxID=3069105 RepID=UPI002E75B6A2|nr:ChrR family anti-sigma-E factor [Dyella sp. A6]